MTLEAADLVEMRRALGLARNHDELVDILVERKAELQLSDALIDELGLFAPGYSGRILGPTRDKTLSQRSLDELCRILAISLLVVVDDNKVARIQHRWEKRKRGYAHPNTRLSKKAFKKAKPLILKENGSLGGMVRAHLLSAKLISDIARKGGRARQKKRRARERAEREKAINTATSSGALRTNGFHVTARGR